MLRKILSKLTYTQLIALGFVLIIFVGAVLLMLPVSSRSGEWTAPVDACFTATSATCVTGLAVVDTYTHWSLFGQIVILCLVQIGGLGFMTVISTLSIFLKKKIALKERRLLMQSAGTMRLEGVVRLVRRIALGSFMFEGAGAVLLAFRFCPQFGALKGIYYSVFHSVSAFCNAGFDLMGCNEQFSSFTGYRTDVLVNLVLCALIVTGGVGFIVWNDVFTHRLNFKKYELHSKIVLAATTVLLLFGWAFFFISEKDASMKNLSVGERILASLFQSVTTRTAGFNTINLSELSESGSLLTCVLMLIGGSPGSTAGGMKTTTVFVLVMGAVTASRRKDDITVFKRRLEDSALKQAGSIAVIYVLAVILSTLVLCLIQPFTMKQALFETVSAIGTVGSTMGITASMRIPAKIMLAFLMYCGRIGGLTLMLVLSGDKYTESARRPKEKILIG